MNRGLLATTVKGAFKIYPGASHPETGCVGHRGGGLA